MIKYKDLVFNSKAYEQTFIGKYIHSSYKEIYDHKYNFTYGYPRAKGTFKFTNVSKFTLPLLALEFLSDHDPKVDYYRPPCREDFKCKPFWIQQNGNYVYNITKETLNKDLQRTLIYPFGDITYSGNIRENPKGLLAFYQYYSRTLKKYLSLDSLTRLREFLYPEKYKKKEVILPPVELVPLQDNVDHDYVIPNILGREDHEVIHEIH